MPPVCGWPRRTEWGVISLEYEAVLSSDRHGCWENNLGPLHKQQVFLTVETYFQPKKGHFILNIFVILLFILSLKNIKPSLLGRKIMSL